MYLKQPTETKFPHIGGNELKQQKYHVPENDQLRQQMSHISKETS